MNLSYDLEQRYIGATSSTYRKQYGQFFTPDPIAELLTQWVAASEPETVLDPAVGTGKLLSGFPDHAALTGYDIEDSLLDHAGAVLREQDDTTLLKRDFLLDNWETKYEGIVCNPPYIKFKSYPNKQEYFSVFKEKMNLDLSGYTNMYVLFLLKGLHQLKQNGRAAFIVPTEFLNAAYGEPVRHLLASRGNLAAAAVTDFTMSWFHDAATTSTLLFIDNAQKDRKTAFFRLEDETALAELRLWLEGKPSSLPVTREVTGTELDASLKWQSFYLDELDISTYALKPLAVFANVNRGIATGANSYFCFTEKKRLAWDLNENEFLPCLSKASQIQEPFFDEEGWKELFKSGEPVLLLNAREEEEKSDALAAYLALGEAEGIHRKYLTNRRRTWYRQERRKPAPILVKTLFRKDPVFIRNESAAVNLTSFHCIYPLPEYEADTDVLMAFLLTDLSRTALASQHKQYGKGLKKFEPGDLKSAPVADLDVLNEKDKDRILQVYERVKTDYHQTGRLDVSGLDALFEQLLQK